MVTRFKRAPVKGFQTAEFVLEHGSLDLIIKRKELKSKLAHLLRLFAN
jgi:acetyl-CoA carboxylase beta subunit